MPTRAGPSRRALLPGTSSSQSQPLLLDGALKFAFDVFEVVRELSNDQLRLSTLSRPNFHPRCTNLMTEEMKELFKDQWGIAEDLKIIYLVMNGPSIHGSDDFAVMLTNVLKSYKKKLFSRKLFVELLFILAFWTLVLRLRSEWVAATDFALELITIYTRFVLDNGGFDNCTRWLTKVKVQGVDLVVTDEED